MDVISNLSTFNPNPEVFEDFFARKEGALDKISPVKKVVNRIKKFHIGTSCGPGPLQCLFFPYEFAYGCYSLVNAISFRQKESVINIPLHLFRQAIGAIYSASYLAALAIQVGILFGKTINLFASFEPLTGCLGSAFCFVLEVKNSIRQYRYLSKCNETLDSLKESYRSLKKDEVLPELNKEALEFLDTFLCKDDSPVTLEEFSKIANRIHPWVLEEYAEELTLTIPKLLWDIRESGDIGTQKQSLKKLVFFVDNVRIQAKKKMIHQLITLVSLSILIAAFAVIVLSQPYLIPAIILTANIALMLGNYFYYSGSEYHLGWDFRPVECIPAWIRSLLKIQAGPRANIFRKAKRKKNPITQVQLPFHAHRSKQIQMFNNGAFSSSRNPDSSSAFTVG